MARSASAAPSADASAPTAGAMAPSASKSPHGRQLRRSKTSAVLERIGSGWQKHTPGLEGLLDEPPAPKVVGPSTRIYEGFACGWCLEPADWPRRPAIMFVEWGPFEGFIFATIICNCALMAWDSALDPPGTWKASLIEWNELVSLYIFSAEALLKMLAFGLPEYALRDGWCQLDAFIVSLSWAVVLLPDRAGSYTGLRALRGLRPLRALKSLPGSRVLVQSILHSLPKVGNVLLLVAFLLLLWAMLSVELFAGRLHHRCEVGGLDTGLVCSPERTLDGSSTVCAVLAAAGGASGDGRSVFNNISSSSLSSSPGSLGPLSSLGILGAIGVGNSSIMPSIGTGNTTNATADGQSGGGGSSRDGGGGDSRDGGGSSTERGGGSSTCAFFGSNPVEGVLSFDSVREACLPLLLALTLDDWTAAMYMLMEALSPAVALFFVRVLTRRARRHDRCGLQPIDQPHLSRAWPQVTLVIFGGFFVVNLFLAVIFEEFIWTQSRETEPSVVLRRQVIAA